MTKQEQIQEMVNVMITSNNPFVDVPIEIMPKVAKALYNAGYRKIPKDSVVLSKEEYEMLTNQYKNLEIKYSNLCDNYRLCKDANETLKQNVIIARKETAKEVLQAVDQESNGQTVSITNHIRKKYSMEVDIK